MSAFKTWWESELSHHDNVASPEEMIAAMQEAFKDTAQLGFNAGLEAAAKVCEDEFLEKPTTNMEDDAYNAAIGHCLAAIRALKDE